jgi:hypothetical protein
MTTFAVVIGSIAILEGVIISWLWRDLNRISRAYQSVKAEAFALGRVAGSRELGHLSDRDPLDLSPGFESISASTDDE